ncbi:MAG: DUF523 domain-containing protein [Coprobacillus sp.]
MKIGVSQCLLGYSCTYSASHHKNDVLVDLYNNGDVVCVCPEVLGGLSTPRDPAEIVNEDPLTIQTIHGVDVTEEYLKGAKKALDIFIKNDVEVAVLKFRSPSCGSDGIYDGTFSHQLINGQGVFVRLLNNHGIKVFHENQIKEFLEYIGKEDDYGTYFKDSTSV